MAAVNEQPVSSRWRLLDLLPAAWLPGRLAAVFFAALIYQLIVGGVKIELTGGRLIVDPHGLFYWWQSLTRR
jgi:hypothetical protein